MAHYLVSVPDTNRALYAGMGRLSPDGQKTLSAGSSEKPALSIIGIWDGTVQNFDFGQQISGVFTWSPDQKYFAVGVSVPNCDCENRYPRELGIVEVATGELRVLTTGEFFAGDAGSAIWSPDSRFITYIEQHFSGEDGQNREIIKIIPVDGSQPPRTLYTFITKGDWVRPFMYWLPNGKHIALRAWITGTSEIWYVDVETAQVTYHQLWFDPSEICWSTQSDHFVVASMTRFKLITPDGSPALDTSFVDPSIWDLNPGSTVPCSWSPDGTKLALVYQTAIPGQRFPPRIKVIDFAQRQVSDIDVGVKTSFWVPFWSHDSRMLALRSYEPSRDPNDVYIYDTVTMQQVLAQTDLEFIAWVANPPS